MTSLTGPDARSGAFRSRAVRFGCEQATAPRLATACYPKADTIGSAVGSAAAAPSEGQGAQAPDTAREIEDGRFTPSG